ncbi:MAG: transport between ER and Golgi ATPase protein [Caeruleum heppii]|nr:MAG: transport between ER and Golgi ATPase protein [Caeruleum heppii]
MSPPPPSNPTDFADLSGTLSSASQSATANPYDALLQASNNDPHPIQRAYTTHRVNRNAQQRAALLDSDFPALTLDPTLCALNDPDKVKAGFRDERHCLVFWARPTQRIRNLVGDIQQKLRSVAPNLWLMPLTHLHMTTLEITHSRTAPDITALLTTLTPSLSRITDYTVTHRARLVKPMLGFDGSAVALSWVPAAGEGSTVPSTATHDDGYTYHHLRRDLYDLCRAVGVPIASRYTVPSAHCTIARFITQDDHSEVNSSGSASVSPGHQLSPQKMRTWIETIEMVNDWLRREFWPAEGKGGGGKGEGEWIVGEEQGLDCRRGPLWYGGGETVRLGQGF